MTKHTHTEQGERTRQQSEEGPEAGNRKQASTSRTPDTPEDVPQAA